MKRLIPHTLVSTIVNFTQYRDDEMDCPVPNRSKLVGVRVLPGNAALEVDLEMDEGSSQVKIDDKRVVVVEYSLIEAILMDSDIIELS